MADYSSVIMGGLRSIGDSFANKRRFDRENMETDRSYSRMLGLDTYNQGQDALGWDWKRQEAQRDQQNADRDYGLAQQRLAEGGGSSELGLNLVPLQDENGEFAGWGQPSKGGGIFPAQVQGGAMRPMSPYERKFSEAAGSGAGKDEGDAIGTYRSMTSRMPGLESVVENLTGLADKATYTLGGQAVDWTRRQLGAEPREAAVARAQYTAIVDNQILPLLRDTFGAQFTQKEGETLRATLGNPDVSPKEKQALLTAFIEQKRRDIEALATRTGGGYAPIQPGENPAADAEGWQTLSNGVRFRQLP